MLNVAMMNVASQVLTVFTSEKKINIMLFRIHSSKECSVMVDCYIIKKDTIFRTGNFVRIFIISYCVMFGIIYYM